MSRLRGALTAGLLAAAIATSVAAAVLETKGLPWLGLALLLAAAAVFKPRYSWVSVLACLLLVILFVPIKRYELALGLPFQLDPYRIALVAVAAVWLLALLGDPSVRLRRTRLDVAVLAVLLATALSIAFNLDRFVLVESTATKVTVFFASYFLLYFLVTSLAHTPAAVERLFKVLVLGGAVVAALAILEPRTGLNPYDSVFSRMPLFMASPVEEFLDPARGSRAVGPAQHPIALGAALVMLLPLAIYLGHRTRRLAWWIAALLLAVASFATLSRTIVIMLVAVGAVFFWLRRAETVKAAPLVVALVVAVHFLVPGALGTMKHLLFPEEGLVAQQSNQWAVVDPESPTACTFTGRYADIGPSLAQAAERPFFGYGFGTRVTVDDPASGVKANACVLDNQWLGNLLDVGVAGLLAWWWLFLRFLRGARAAAGRADENTAWLATALAASVAAFGAGMFVFDAFAFIQPMLLLFILLAFGGTVLGWAEPRTAGEPSTISRKGPRRLDPRLGT